VLAQFFDSAGAPLGTTFTVNTTTAGFQGRPRVAADDAGNFVVVWWNGSYTVSGRRIAPTGAPQPDPQFQINTTAYGVDPKVVMSSTGNFAAFWSSFDAGGQHVYGQRFDSSQNPQGAAFIVAEASPVNSISPSIAMNPLGNFVATWTDDGRIVGRRFDAVAMGGPVFRVNSPTMIVNRAEPSVAIAPNGRFVTAWSGTDPISSSSRIFVALSKDVTTINLTSTLNPSTTGAAVTFNATVTPSTATGSVTFLDGVTTLDTRTLAGGVASFTTSTLNTGSHSITAVYGGDASFLAATSDVLTQTVNPNPLSPPPSFQATATSISQISVSWGAVTNETGYELSRTSVAGTVTTTMTATATSIIDTAGIQPNTTYLYKVRTLSAGGPSSYTAIDPATTIMFTDTSLVGVAAKAAHITELQTAVNAIRAAAGLSTVVFTDVTLPANRTIRAAHVTELRTALDAVLTQPGFTAISYTDPTLTPQSTKLKAAHITEIRAAVQ
jgi:hypothetical protein